MTYRYTVLIASLAVMVASASATWAADLGPLLTTIKAVGKDGSGNPEAAKAWQELSKSGPEAIVIILEALDDADARAANWLRSAVDTIAERELAAGRTLPAAKLEAFLKETKHSPRGRRLAFELLARVDKTAPDRLIPGMLHDPSVELRRDAVARHVKEADQLLDKGDKKAALAAYRKVLAGARDPDQVEHIAKQLQSLDAPVDFAGHFGFIQKWLLVAPFDNVKMKGFNAVYQPEQGIDLAATFMGKDGNKVGWKYHASPDGYGVVDLNKVIAKHMGVVGYAYAVVDSPKEQTVHIRAGSNNAVKIWLNGKQIYFREEYHHGMKMDQHATTGVLKQGKNEILIKVCQNEQPDPWAQKWDFQLRVCDSVGGAVPLTVITDKVAGKLAGGEAKP